MAKWAFEIDDPERIPEVLARAYTEATSGRPGPVVLALPEDVLAAEVDVDDAPRYRAARPAAVGRGARGAGGAARGVGAAVRARRRRAVGRDAARAFTRWALGCGLPVGATFRRQDVVDNMSRATPATSASASTRARPADPRLRPAGGGRHAAGRDRDAGLHAARAAGRAAAARPRPPRPRRARARLPAVAAVLSGVAEFAAAAPVVDGARWAELDRRGARRLRGVDRARRRRRATASTWAR